jgi:3-oxoacyl-(acyl-carrier-protein) synthase
MAHPDPQGVGAGRAMEWAIQDAGLKAQNIDYINTHGTATLMNDWSETAAIKRVFGQCAFQVPMSSTKSMIGHTMGGAGAIEAIVCVKTMEQGIIHPTINLETPDPKCDLDYVPGVARKAAVQVTLSNSFGLGGQNACLVLGTCQPNL